MIRQATTTDRSPATCVAAARILVLLLALIAGACTIKLAPDYDQSILDGLGKVNDNAQVFFAAIAGGSSKSDFVKEDATYSQLIGEVNALALQAKARPEPPPPAILAWLSSRQPTDQPLQLKTPTPDILNNLAKTLADMRKQNQKAGLAADDVVDFKMSFDQKMSQALTYEKALKR
ncbi:MAG TPA: hypothetical protein VLX85_05695 [Stellaceae bacterium]|nr:hypothetical protein [Stellaceae bacterium]